MSERTARTAIACLAVVGIGISSYLLYERWTGGSPVCTSGGCETVQQSSYAKLAGLPVALIGLLGYVAILAASLTRGETARAVTLALALVALAFSLYLLVVQLAVIDAVCVWCVSSDVVVTAIAVIALLGMRAPPEPVEA